MSFHFSRVNFRRLLLAKALGIWPAIITGKRAALAAGLFLIQYTTTIRGRFYLLAHYCEFRLYGGYLTFAGIHVELSEASRRHEYPHARRRAGSPLSEF